MRYFMFLDWIERLESVIENNGEDYNRQIKKSIQRREKRALYEFFDPPGGKALD
jgi:hypothetical protein